MKRKLLAIWMCVAILLGIQVSAAFVDMQGENASEAVTVLSALGVFEGKDQIETFAPNDGLTRAESAAIITRLTGVGQAVGEELPFDDVQKDHWAYSDIAVMYKMHIMQGMSERSFAPDASVTLDEAVKIVVSMLGYSVQAESLGGYPLGYLVKAEQLNILRGVTRGEVMTRGDMAILIYNAIDVPPLVKTSYGTKDNAEYKVLHNETFLSHYRGIEKAEGQIIAIHGAAVKTHGYSLQRNDALVGDTVFKNSYADSYLGFEVKLYYTAENDICSTLCVVPKKTTKVISVDGDSVSDKTTKTCLYYDAVDEEQVTIAQDALLAQNGEPKASWDRTDLLPEDGRLTCIINQRGEIDVVLVSQYDVYVVDSVDTKNEVIYLMHNSKNKTSITMDDTYEAVSLINSEGNEITTEELTKWDVLTVTEVTGKSLQIICSRKNIKGTIVEAAEKDVYIGADKYKLHMGMTEDIKVGIKGLFYLNNYGEIAAVDTAASKAFKYAFLIGAQQKKGIDGDVEIKLFSEDGTMVLFCVTDRIKLNGTLETKEIFLNKLEKNIDDTVKRQLIRYETNAEGTQLMSMETAQDNIDENKTGVEALNWGQSCFTKDYYIDSEGLANGIEAEYKGGFLRTFAGRMMLRETTKVFSIPRFDAADKDYKILSYTDLIDDEYSSSKYADVSLFDVDPYGVVGAMVWDFSAAGKTEGVYPTSNNKQAIIKSVDTVYNEESGEKEQRLKVFTSDQQELCLPIDEDTEAFFKTSLTSETVPKNVNGSLVMNYKIKASELKAGDVIQYAMQGDSLQLINVMFRANTPGEWDQYWGIFTREWQPYYGNAEKCHGSVYTAFGTVQRVGPYTIVATVKDKTKPGILYTRTYTTFTNSSSSILSYDMKRQKLKLILPSDICPGDKIFVSTQTTNPRLIIRYENI